MLGIGDDCAIYRPRGSADDLLFTSDMFIESVHFARNTHKPVVAGRKALVRSLSDIAAMGGAPKFCLVSLCVPDWAQARWVDRFFAGILKLAASTGATLAGGDLSMGIGWFATSLFAGRCPGEKLCGEMALARGMRFTYPGRWAGRRWVWKRCGERRGSGICIRNRDSLSAPSCERSCAPQPQLMSAMASRSIFAVLCLASRVGAEIVPPPSFRGASLDQALHGGEEYELLFTVRRGTKVPPEFEGLPLTRIGKIVPGEGDVRLNGQPLKPLGYDHFDRRGR